MRGGSGWIGQTDWFGSIFINSPFFKDNETLCWLVMIFCLISGIIFLLYMVKE